MGEQQLANLGVKTFSDYLKQLPNVTAGGSGPGQNTIYIRGLASTTPNLTTAGVAGLAPNVSLYLDEQPISQPGRNLDVYAADLQADRGSFRSAGNAVRRELAGRRGAPDHQQAGPLRLPRLGQGRSLGDPSRLGELQGRGHGQHAR